MKCRQRFGRLLGLGLILIAYTMAEAQTDQKFRCGEIIELQTHDNTTTRVAYIAPQSNSAHPITTTLILFPGGSGYANLNGQGCAQALRGNSLVRSMPLFAKAGFGVALMDAPSDSHDSEGLAGFRVEQKHAHDIGKLIELLRARTQGKIWLVGTSRGTISAVNAASRLTGTNASDGLILTSVLMQGQTGAKRKWVTQTVFDLPLENIQIPLLIIGHAADTCVRSPPKMMSKVGEKTRSKRYQMTTVTGGPEYAGMVGVDSCEGKAPHGFAGQEEEIAALITKFVTQD